MPTSARWVAIAAAGLLATLAGCSSADPAPSGGPPPAQSSSSPHTDDDEKPAADNSASKAFCNSYAEHMAALLEGGSAAKAALPKLDALVAGAPAEFQQWITDFRPWVKAKLDDDSAALKASAEASEEAGYQISNRCQFVLADM
ncbi:MAG: hypothetical protein ACTHJJ_02215 [Intrasporangium sp.]|uniref:hypothetical protein n=1 Tax=Intrasporangium sp. TaxID=1925024 RepID=UPI003F817D50